MISTIQSDALKHALAGLDRRSPLPLHAQLQERIKRMIVAGGLKAGDRIPSEREWSTRLELSRNTVRLAIAGLIREGILERRGARGTYIRKAPAVRVEETRRFGIAFADEPEKLADPAHLEFMFMPILSGFSQEARADGVVGTLFSLSPLALGQDLPVVDLDALLVLGHASEEMLEKLSEKVAHVVFISNYPLSGGFNQIRIDSQRGAKEGTRRILEQGITDVCLITGDPGRFRGAGEIIKGYRRALAESGVSELENIRIHTSERPGYEIASELLRERQTPCGILAAGTPLLQTTLRAYFEAGPRWAACAIVGYVEGGFPVGEALGPAAVIGTPFDVCGRRAYQVLRQLASGEVAAPVDVTIEPTWLVRPDRDA